MKLLYLSNLQRSQGGLVCQSAMARLSHVPFDADNTRSLLPTCSQVTAPKDKHNRTSSSILCHLLKELWRCSTCISHYREAPGETAYICRGTLKRALSNSCTIRRWWMRMIGWKSWIEWRCCGGREWEALKDGRRCRGSAVRHQMVYSTEMKYILRSRRSRCKAKCVVSQSK